MGPPVEKIYASCLIAGFLYSFCLWLGGSHLLRFKLRLWPHIRLPRLLPRSFTARLPRVPRPRIRPGLVGKASGGSVGSPGSLHEPSLASPWVIPLFLGMFITLFGATGLVSRIGLNSSPHASLLIASFGGGIAALIVVRGMSRLFAGEASALKGKTILLTTGNVSVSIPEGGVGSMAFISEGKRVTMPAREKHGHGLPQGTPVIVVELDGRIASVEEFRA